MKGEAGSTVNRNILILSQNKFGSRLFIKLCSMRRDEEKSIRRSDV